MKWPCCFVFVICTITDVKVISGKISQSKSIDYFTLAMEWPRGFCEVENTVHERDCVVSKDIPGWVLHGLWPSGLRSNPQYCNKSLKFDYNKLKYMESSLIKYWPNLFTNAAKTRLWKHEYERHGTCAAAVNGFETEEKYFRKAMELLHKYDPMYILQNAGIEPSANEAYDSDRITHVLKSGYGVDVCPRCSDTTTKVAVLSELHICLTKDLKLMKCPDVCDVKYHCTGKVYYRPLPGMSKRLSGGTFLFLLLLPGLILYFVMGMLFNCSRGKEGVDIIPHREFLAELPELIFDGIMFTVDLVTCSQEQTHTGLYQDTGGHQDTGGYSDQDTGGNRDEEPVVSL